MATRPRRGSAARPVSSSLPALDAAEWRLRYLRAVNATGAQAPGADSAAAVANPQTREPTHDLGDGLRFVGEGGKEEARAGSGAGGSSGSEVGIVGSLPQRPAPLALRQMANRKRSEGGQDNARDADEAGSPPIHGAAPGSSSALALPPAAPHRRAPLSGLHRPPTSTSPRPTGSRPVAVPVRGASYQLAVPDVELATAASPSGPSSMSSSSSGLGAIFRSPSGTGAVSGRRTSATSAASAATPGLTALQTNSGGSEASSDSRAVTAFLDGVGAGVHADDDEEEDDDGMFFAFGEDDGMPGGGQGGWVDGLATPRQLSSSSPRGFIPPHELAARGRIQEEFVPGSQPM